MKAPNPKKRAARKKVAGRKHRPVAPWDEKDSTKPGSTKPGDPIWSFPTKRK